VAVSKNTTAFKIEITPDAQQAYLTLRADQKQISFSDLEVLEAIKKRNILTNDFVRNRVKELMLHLADGKLGEPFLVAEGQPPSQPIGEQFIWADSLKPIVAPGNDEGAINFYSRHQIMTVEADTIIGRIDPFQPGKPGLDVFGKSVNPRQSPSRIHLGQNVVFEPDGRSVRATAAGQVILERGKLSVRSVLDVKGDVSFETGNIDSASDVLVHGSIRDLFVVKSKRKISIKGMVDSAFLQADGDITIVGGVKGRGKALMEAGGDIHAKFLDSVYAIAGGDVEIANEAIDSTILCSGHLKMKHGVILGGRQYATGGIRAKTIGSPSGVKTVVGVGTDPRLGRHLLELDATIEKSRDLVAKIQKHVTPLLQQLKRLTAEQREKATELMCHAETVEQNIQKMLEEKQAIMNGFPNPLDVELVVFSKIFPNTQVQIAHKVVAIKEEIAGPFRIVLRRENGVTEMILINKLSGSIRTLPAQRVGIEHLDVPERPQSAQLPFASVDQSQEILAE
jgi:hypothetical protein